MFEGNESFKEFRDKLNARGVLLRCLWEAHAGVWRGGSADSVRGADKRRHDVALYTFVSTKPEITVPSRYATAVLIDYGPRDGFGLFYPAQTNLIDDDVNAICGDAA